MSSEAMSFPFSAHAGYLHPCSPGLLFLFPFYNFIPLTFLYLSMTVRFPGSLPWVYNIYQVLRRRLCHCLNERLCGVLMWL